MAAASYGYLGLLLLLLLHGELLLLHPKKQLFYFKVTGIEQ